MNANNPEPDITTTTPTPPPPPPNPPPQTSLPPRQKVTEADTAEIERLLQTGASYSSIRQAVPNVSRTNLYLKISRFRASGACVSDPTTRNKGGRPRIIDADVDVFIKGLLAARPEIELAEMAALLEREMGRRVSTSCCSRAVTRISGGPRSRGLKSRRLGELKVRRLAEAEGGAVPGGGVVQVDLGQADQKVAESEGYANAQMHLLDPGLFGPALSHVREYGGQAAGPTPSYRRVPRQSP